jgi:DNA-binding LacI/PurR family transcriptional regulator
MAKLRDIARQAGVSMGTASGVMNGVKHFAEPTRRRVLDAASELGYAPNLAAKAIRRCPTFHGRPPTNIIAHVNHVLDTTANNPFVETGLLLLAHLAAAKGYYVLPLFYDQATAFACPPVQNGQVDGVLASVPDLEIARTVGHLAPLVLMNVPFWPELLPEVSLVNFDLRHGMRAMARHLAGLGHRRIATLTMNQEDAFSYHGVRCPALAMACADAGLTLHPDLSRSRQLSPRNHEQVMNEFVAEALPLIRAGEVTALMMVDDQYASEMCNRLGAAGLRVPDDVSVTGFAASPMTSLQMPLPLTTVSYPWAALLDAALDLLIAEINGRDHRQGEIRIRPDLVIAATTAIAPQPGRCLSAKPVRVAKTPQARPHV